MARRNALWQDTRARVLVQKSDSLNAAEDTMQDLFASLLNLVVARYVYHFGAIPQQSSRNALVLASFLVVALAASALQLQRMAYRAGRDSSQIGEVARSNRKVESTSHSHTRRGFYLSASELFHEG